MWRINVCLKRWHALRPHTRAQTAWTAISPEGNEHRGRRRARERCARKLASTATQRALRRARVPVSRRLGNRARQQYNPEAVACIAPAHTRSDRMDSYMHRGATSTEVEGARGRGAHATSPVLRRIERIAARASQGRGDWVRVDSSNAVMKLCHACARTHALRPHGQLYAPEGNEHRVRRRAREVRTQTRQHCDAARASPRARAYR